GDRGRDAPDVLHPRFVHPVKELPHVRAKSFDITALAFCVNRIERETRFAAAAGASDDSHFAKWKIDIDALKVVLARPANLNATRLRPVGRRGHAVFFKNL